MAASPVEDRRTEDDVSEPDSEMRGDDSTRGGRGDPVEQRLADGRRGIGVVVELAGVAIGDELVALVDEEQRRIAGDLGGAVRRVVDGHDEGVGREPVVGHDLPHRPERGGGDDDVGVTGRGAGVRRRP